MMVLDSGAGVGWHSEHWDEVAERPNWTEPDELNFLSISTRLVDNHCRWFISAVFLFLKPIPHEVLAACQL